MSLPFMQGYGISEAIQSYRIPKVSRIAYRSTVPANLPIYGICGTFSNGTREIYILDDGVSICCVGSRLVG
jgi:hypothetical protein